jgi:hypothetical protein
VSRAGCDPRAANMTTLAYCRLEIMFPVWTEYDSLSAAHPTPRIPLPFISNGRGTHRFVPTTVPKFRKNILSPPSGLKIERQYVPLKLWCLLASSHSAELYRCKKTHDLVCAEVVARCSCVREAEGHVQTYSD